MRTRTETRKTRQQRSKERNKEMLAKQKEKEAEKEERLPKEREQKRAFKNDWDKKKANKRKESTEVTILTIMVNIFRDVSLRTRIATLRRYLNLPWV